MILRSSPASPFVRKVRIAAVVLGLADKIEVRETDLNDPADAIRVQNPLGKIPALIVDDGTVYYDSRVILEVLDHIAGGGRIIPREPAARFAALRLQALCDGILDASALIVYEERYRPADKRGAELDRPPGRQGRARPGSAGSRAAAARSDRRTSDRSRLPACSAIAICASAAPGARSIRACSPGTTPSPRKCRPLPRPRSLSDPAA